MIFALFLKAIKSEGRKTPFFAICSWRFPSKYFSSQKSSCYGISPTKKKPIVMCSEIWLFNSCIERLPPYTHTQKIHLTTAYGIPSCLLWLLKLNHQSKELHLSQIVKTHSHERERYNFILKNFAQEYSSHTKVISTQALYPMYESSCQHPYPGMWTGFHNSQVLRV